MARVYLLLKAPRINWGLSQSFYSNNTPRHNNNSYSFLFKSNVSVSVHTLRTLHKSSFYPFCIMRMLRLQKGIENCLGNVEQKLYPHH